MSVSTPITEADILTRVVRPERADLSPAAAEAIMKMGFDAETTKIVQQLLRKNNRGGISAEDRVDLEKYLRVGQLLDLLQAKARQSLAAVPA